MIATRVIVADQPQLIASTLHRRMITTKRSLGDQAVQDFARVLG
jgi:hypothetical protein